MIGRFLLPRGNEWSPSTTSHNSIEDEIMPLKGVYLTRSRTKWIEVHHLVNHPRTNKVIKLAGFTSKKELYSEILFDFNTWIRLYNRRHEIAHHFSEGSPPQPYKVFLDSHISLELCMYDADVGKVLCFIENNCKIYMKLNTFTNMMSYNDWVRSNFPRFRRNRRR